MKLTGWRKVANAVWGEPNDPQIYGMMEPDATKIVAFIDRAREAGYHVTPTHIVGRAVAVALREMPDINVRIVAGRVFPRETVDVFWVTAVSGGHDLTGVKIERADEKSAYQVAEELSVRAHTMKAGRDPDLARSKRALEVLPVPVLHYVAKLSSWVAGTLNLGIPPLALKASPFGGAMVTSVGMFGLPTGFAPLSWVFRVPMLIVVGSMTHKPLAVDGKVEIRPVLPVSATLDHRYMDGWHVSQALKHFQAYLADPFQYEPDPPPKRV